MITNVMYTMGLTVYVTIIMIFLHFYFVWMHVNQKMFTNVLKQLNINTIQTAIISTLKFTTFKINIMVDRLKCIYMNPY